MPDKLWYLSRLDLFEKLSTDQMQQLAQLMRDRHCHVGEEIVVRPSGDRIYLVKKGRVQVLQGPVGVSVLEPGQLFGTSSLFGAAAIDQRVVALDEVVVCDAPAAQFLAAVTMQPRLAARLVTLLARQLFDLEQAVQRSAAEKVPQRLADLLLRTARRDGGRVEVRGTAQADLARMIGASRESVSRLVAEWEREGIVRVGARRIELLDEDRLARLAGR